MVNLINYLLFFSFNFASIFLFPIYYTECIYQRFNYTVKYFIVGSTNPYSLQYITIVPQYYGNY